MTSDRRIYLDHAATSWPKPASVLEAMNDWYCNVGAAAGRSASRQGVESGKIVQDARTAVARLIGAENSNEVVFAFNGTDALNLAIHGAVRSGGHVVTTVAEHNSVLRPLSWQRRQHAACITHVPCDGEGFVDPKDVLSALRDDTCLVAMIHASNVTGAVQNVAEVGAGLRQRGVLFLVDAAQSLGEIPVNVQDIGCDLLAAPGHKGLLGPLGTGILYVRESVAHRIEPYRQGGTGTKSEADVQPDSMPDRLESGNLNVPALAGMLRGVDWLLARGIEKIHAEKLRLLAHLRAQLADNSEIQWHGPREASRQVGVISLSIDGWDPQEVAGVLDADFGIQVRSGIQCAPRMHASLGTLNSGGTVRLSLGPMTTQADVDAAIHALRQITRGA